MAASDARSAGEAVLEAAPGLIPPIAHGRVRPVTLRRPTYPYVPVEYSAPPRVVPTSSWRSIAARGDDDAMSTHADPEEEAAVAAAKARRVIADRIAKLAPGVENDDLALVVLHLAEAYGHLAAEPPRTRGN